MHLLLLSIFLTLCSFNYNNQNFKNLLSYFKKKY